MSDDLQVKKPEFLRAPGVGRRGASSRRTAAVARQRGDFENTYELCMRLPASAYNARPALALADAIRCHRK